jgi:protein TonB
MLLVIALHFSIAIPFLWFPAPKVLSQSPTSVIRGTLVIASDPVTVKKKTPKIETKPIKHVVKKIPKKKKPTLELKTNTNKAIRKKVIGTSNVQEEPSSSFQEQAKAPSPIKNHVVAAITPPSIEATHMSNPRPSYPKLSRRRGEEGTVLLEVLILVDGSVGKVRIKKSSGFRRLDKAALKAVKRWHYQAAKRGSLAIEYWYLQPLKFHLKQAA